MFLSSRVSAPPAILLAAHGSGDDSAINHAVIRLRDRLAQRLPNQIVVAFQLGTPHFSQALAHLQAQRILVIPLMLASGHFADRKLPAALAANANFAQIRITLAPPIGEHPGLMQQVITAVAREITRQAAAAAQVRVLVVGHGTARHSASRATTCEAAAGITRAHGVPAAACFLDDEPLLQDIKLTQHDRLVLVVPWLLGGGEHVLRDIPQRLKLPAADPAEAATVRTVDAHNRRYLLLPALIHSETLPQVVEEIVRTHNASATETEQVA